MSAHPPRVAYLGPEGTFSYFTGLAFLSGAELVPCRDFGDLFRAVENGGCRLGLVPLENSLRGSVGQSFDLFLRHNVSIRGEAFSRISNCLLSRELDFSGIKVVYSHAQPLAQCAGWLRDNLPEARVVPAASTAAAALTAAEENGAAAIGHRLLSGMSGLAVLASGIEDEKENRTRFVVISRPDDAVPLALAGESPVPGWKSSMIFTARDEPGSLADVLLCLKRGGINMRKLESRPMNGGAHHGTDWKYAFFADVECDLSSPAHAAALDELRARCSSLRLLGSYRYGPKLEDGGPEQPETAGKDKA